jgi:nucleoside-diphosphate-sugar epimerase
MDKLKVLLTGSQGRMGPNLVAAFRERYDLRTYDLKAAPDDANAFQGDLQDFAALKTALQGVDVLVHLAATSDEAPFVENLVPNNVIGMYNSFQAALECGVRRIVFASTCQTMSFNWRGKENVSPLEPPRPSTLYGATKVLGETVGRWYHDKHGLEFIAIRIGAYQPYDSDWLKQGRAGDIWLSPRDAVQLFQLAIEKPEVGYAVVCGTSKTPVERMSLQEAREVLGYEPMDKTTDYFAVKTEI